MEVSPKAGNREDRRGRRGGVTRLCAVAAVVVAAVLAVGCGRRVSYNVRTVYVDPRFSAVSVSASDIAVMPFLTSRGTNRDGDLGARNMTGRLRAQRPDLSLVSYEEFENGFPPRFDRRRLADFYGLLFREEIDSVRALDSLWKFVGQQYVLVFAFRDGAVIHNVDQSYFKHVSVTCELWSRESRSVVWRSSCRGVSDDRRVPPGVIFTESMRLLVNAIPAAAPTTSGKPVPPGVGGEAGVR